MPPRRSLLLLLSAALAAPLLAAHAPHAAGTHGTDWSGERADLAAWVKGLQYADPAHPSVGALRVHHDPGTVGPGGVAYWHVVPYEANRAVTGLLRTDDAARLDVAERWMGWYLNHTHAGPAVDPLLPEGIVFDHWYRADGSGETTCAPAAGLGACLYRDADDSNAATFLALTWAYREEGGARAEAFLDEPGRKAQLEMVARVVLGLMDADDLTFARPDWRYKYLMDNSESYCGLRAMAILEDEQWGDAANATLHADAADRVRAAILSKMWNGATGSYRTQIDPAGMAYDRDLTDWYPGTVATVWPALHNVTAGDSPVAVQQVENASAAWDGTARPNWTQAYTSTDPTEVTEAKQIWTAMGHAALLAGDEARALAHTEFVKAEKMDHGYPARFTAGDAGWLLLTLVAEVQQPEKSLMCP